MKSKSNPDILKMAAAAAKRSERTMRSKVSFQLSQLSASSRSPMSRIEDSRQQVSHRTLRSSFKCFTPSTACLWYYMPHCVPTVASLLAASLLACILLLWCNRNCGVSDLTHTLLVCFPPSVFSLWVVTCPGTVRGCWGRVCLRPLLL